MARYKILSGAVRLGDRNYVVGDVVETAVDLRSRNIPGQKERVELIEGDPSPSSSLSPSPSSSSPAAVVASPKDPLEGMKVRELRALAESENIFLGEVKTKAEILEVLREAMS